MFSFCSKYWNKHLFKHFDVSALTLSPQSMDLWWVDVQITNIVRLPVILNFALVLTCRVLFQTSISEKYEKYFGV